MIKWNTQNQWSVLYYHPNYWVKYRGRGFSQTELLTNKLEIMELFKPEYFKEKSHITVWEYPGLAVMYDPSPTAINSIFARQ